MILWEQEWYSVSVERNSNWNKGCACACVCVIWLKGRRRTASKVSHHLSGNRNKLQHVLYFQNVTQVSVITYATIKWAEFFPLQNRQEFHAHAYLKCSRKLNFVPLCAYTKWNHSYCRGTLISWWSIKEKEVWIIQKEVIKKQGSFETTFAWFLYFCGIMKKEHLFGKITLNILNCLQILGGC